MSDENDEKGAVPDPGESSSQDSPEEFSTQPATQPMEGNESQDETMDESQTEYEEKQVQHSQIQMYLALVLFPLFDGILFRVSEQKKYVLSFFRYGVCCTRWLKIGGPSV